MSLNKPMRSVENRPSEGPHFNPNLIEWSIPQEGLIAQLQIYHPEMELLPTEAREQMSTALGRFIQLCEYMIDKERKLSANNLPIEKSCSFLANYMLYLQTFYKSMAGESEKTHR